MTRPEDFLRSLYRKRRLTDAELNGRLRSLDALAAGKLRPPQPLIRSSAKAALSRTSIPLWQQSTAKPNVRRTIANSGLCPSWKDQAALR